MIGAHADVGVLVRRRFLAGDSDRPRSRETNFRSDGAIQVMRNGAKIPPTGTEIYDPPSPLDRDSRPGAESDRHLRQRRRRDCGGDLARHSDVVIVFAKQWMSEGRDVPNLSLPGDQDALIAAVAAANPRTIVVLETGGPVLMPWLRSGRRRARSLVRRKRRRGRHRIARCSAT